MIQSEKCIRFIPAICIFLTGIRCVYKNRSMLDDEEYPSIHIFFDLKDMFDGR